MTSDGDGRRYALLFVLFLTAITAFRLVYAASCGLDLAPDEAYYWDWSRNLAWGYYSKPPMVAWLYRLVSELGGSTTFGVRTAAALLMAGTMTVDEMLDITKRLLDTYSLDKVPGSFFYDNDTGKMVLEQEDYQVPVLKEYRTPSQFFWKTWYKTVTKYINKNILD